MQYTLHSTQYTLHSTQYAVRSMQYTLHTAHYTLHTAHCTLHTAHCHIAHCTLHAANCAQCTLHTAHCTAHHTRHTPRLWYTLHAPHTTHVRSRHFARTLGAPGHHGHQLRLKPRCDSPEAGCRGSPAPGPALDAQNAPGTAGPLEPESLFHRQRVFRAEGCTAPLSLFIRSSSACAVLHCAALVSVPSVRTPGAVCSSRGTDATRGPVSPPTFVMAVAVREPRHAASFGAEIPSSEVFGFGRLRFSFRFGIP